MNNAFYIAATGLRAQDFGVQLIANNVANLATPGFKRADVRFSALVAPTATPSGMSETNSTLMNGVAASGVGTEMNPGELKRTENSMDVAIDGAGFIEVLGADGQSYLWRGGRLTINADGRLATENGYMLAGALSAAPAGAKLRIDLGGEVTAAGDDGAQVLGQIELVMTKGPNALDPYGEGLFKADAGALVFNVKPGSEGAGLIAQGALESSNVNLSEEMVTLMILQRAYAANAQLVQAADQMMALANGLKR